MKSNNGYGGTNISIRTTFKKKKKKKKLANIVF